MARLVCERRGQRAMICRAQGDGGSGKKGPAWGKMAQRFERGPPSHGSAAAGLGRTQARRDKVVRRDGPTWTEKWAAR